MLIMFLLRASCLVSCTLHAGGAAWFNHTVLITALGFRVEGLGATVKNTSTLMVPIRIHIGTRNFRMNT